MVAIGALAILGVGAVLGAMHASRKYNTIKAETENREFFIAQYRPQAYQALYIAIKSNQGSISNIEAYTKSSNCKNIEAFLKSANLKETLWSVVTYSFWG